MTLRNYAIITNTCTVFALIGIYLSSKNHYIVGTAISLASTIVATTAYFKHHWSKKHE